MERRNFMKSVVVGAGAVAWAGGSAAQEYFPTQVDQSLWKGINRLQDPDHETPVEKAHVPVITAPAKVEAGKPFDVSIAVGKVLHSMGPRHWIEYVQLSIGNEPAGTVLFRSHGYMKPTMQAALVLDDDLKGKKVSLVATLKCNLHGIWQHYVDVEVV